MEDGCCDPYHKAYCYLNRYGDLKSAFGSNTKAAKEHWRDHGEGLRERQRQFIHRMYFSSKPDFGEPPPAHHHTTTIPPLYDDNFFSRLSLTFHYVVVCFFIKHLAAQPRPFD